MKPDQRESEIVEAACSMCNRDTRHRILKAHGETGETEHVSWYELDYQIIQCLGCTHTCFRQFCLSSEDTDFDGRPFPEIKIYPDPTKRIPQTEIYKLPKNIRNLYVETMTCFDSKAMIMSAAALRAVVEAACLDQGCNSGNLKDKIDCLTTKGVLLKRDADYLHQHRFLGNKAVHELVAPPIEEFQIALKILEHLLNSVYVIPQLGATLVALRAERGAQTQ